MLGLEGQTFAGYEVLKMLGQGGMGVVYKARDINLDRPIALKILSNHLAQNPAFIARFRREATLAAKLDHPNLIRVFSAGEFNGTHYIAMELVEGESARDRLLRNGRLSFSEALTIGGFIAEALDHAWQHAKLIHRDIKPANIFLSNTGQVKLGDLGLAKSASETNNELTGRGHAVGTPFYISPEQGRGEKEIDFRADIYSLGCTLYHFIAGEPPYASGDSMAIIHKHIYDPLPPITAKIPDCPVPLALLLAKMMSKMMSKYPDARHQSYAELIADMQQLRYQLLEPVKPPPPTATSGVHGTAPSPQRSHVLVYYVVAAALLAIGGGLFLWEPWKPALKAPTVSAASGQVENQKPSPTSAMTPPAKAAASPVAPAAAQSSKDSFAAEIATLPAEEQIKRVVKQLQRLNPGFDGQATPIIESDRVIGLTFSSVAVMDISPLRALPHLRRLYCSGDKDKPSVSNLSPLRGLRLETLDCGDTQVGDLSPLMGMPLQELRCSTTRVSDLSPLKNAPLNRLDIFHTSVSDLSPLANSPLRWFNCKTTRVQDLAALRNTPMEELHCDASLVQQHDTVLRAIPSLKVVNAQPYP
ncbi:MAG: protein kinase [Verrucomicrobiia bacterium]